MEHSHVLWIKCPNMFNRCIVLVGNVNIAKWEKMKFHLKLHRISQVLFHFIKELIAI